MVKVSFAYTVPWVELARVELLIELDLRPTRCHLPYGVTQCQLPPDTIWHTPPLPQPDRRVLDLPTPEGWKAELTLLTGYIPPIQVLSCLTVHGWELNSQTVDHKSDSLSITLPSASRIGTFVLTEQNVLCCCWAGWSFSSAELVESFTYLGCRIDAHGGSEEEIRGRIEIARGCMKSLTKNIWHSSISPRVKVQLYSTYILPVLLYGSEMWDMTVRSSQRLEAYDQWCLRHILRGYESLSLPVSPTRKSACDLLNLLSPRRSCSGVWGSSATSSVLTPMRINDHTRALNAGINDPPKEWKWPCGRPRQIWLCAIENDLKHQNLGLWSARHGAYDRDLWRDIVETVTLLQGHATWWWWWTKCRQDLLSL